MRQNLWTVILALLAGLGLGLLYSWAISPTRVIDSAPIALRADFKDQYRASIAAAYAGSGNLERARARLDLLGDGDPVGALNLQAQRMLASGDFQQANQLAALSSALGNGVAFIPQVTATVRPAPIGEATSTRVEAGVASATQEISTVTEEFFSTQVILIEATPRPTKTAIPTQGAPFTLIGQETVCDSNLPDGLLQVLVLNSRRRQMAGVEIQITWNGGEDRFFTGLKPELGNGYADFIMVPDIAYTLQLAVGSDAASSLIAPRCETSSGDSFTGGFKLTFQQP